MPYIAVVGGQFIERPDKLCFTLQQDALTKLTYLCIERVEYGNVMNQYALTTLIRVGCFLQHQYWRLSSFLHLKYYQTFTASEVPCCLKHSVAYFWYIYTFTGRASPRTQQPVTLHSYCPLNFQGVAFPVHVLRSSWPVSSTDWNDIVYVLLQIFSLVQFIRQAE